MDDKRDEDNKDQLQPIIESGQSSANKQSEPFSLNTLQISERKRLRFQDIHQWEEKLHQKTNIFRNIFLQMNRSLICFTESSNKSASNLILFFKEKANQDQRYSERGQVKLEKHYENNGLGQVIIEIQQQQYAMQDQYKNLSIYIKQQLIEKQLKPDLEAYQKISTVFQTDSAKQYQMIENLAIKLISRYYEYRHFYQDLLRQSEKGKVMEKDMLFVEDIFFRLVRGLINSLKQFALTQVEFYEHLLIIEQQRKVLTMGVMKNYLQETLKISSNSTELQSIYDRIQKDESILIQFNQLQCENMFLIEQYHYIKQVHPEKTDLDLLHAFVENFEMKQLQDNLLIIYQCQGTHLDENYNKSKYGECFIYLTVDMNILIYSLDESLQEPLANLRINQTQPILQAEKKIISFREFKKSVFSSKKDLEFKLDEAQDIYNFIKNLKLTQT